MSRHQVYTESKAGGDRCYLGTLAKISGLQWTWGWQGPQSCQFNFLADVRYSHRALGLGRTLTVLGGASKAWTGVLTKPGRGSPWQVQADGIAALANNYLAVPGASGNVLNLNEVVDGAIARGLPWTSRPNLPTGLGDPTSGGGVSSIPTLAADLSQVLPDGGLTWAVDTAGALSDPLPPTGAPTYLFLTADPAGGRTLDGYVTAYLVVYNATANGQGATVWARNTAAELLFPPVEQILDVTDRGTLTPAQATAIGQAQLALAGPRAPWASSLVFGKGMIRNAWGSAVDPATVRPPCLGRMLLIDPDHPAETSYAAATDFWVGQTTYDDDAGTVAVSPLDLSSSDLFAASSVSGSAGASSSDSGGFTIEPGSAWFAPTLLNSWVNYGSGYRDASYRMTFGGTVELRGLIKNGVTTAGTDIFQLPTGFRPAADLVFIVDNNAQASRIYIRATGVVEIAALPGGAQLSLNGIRFAAN